MNIRRRVALYKFADVVPQPEGPKNLLCALYRSGVDVEQCELYLVSLESCRQRNSQRGKWPTPGVEYFNWAVRETPSRLE